MTLQAKILTVPTTSIAGHTVTKAQLSEAVTIFNSSADAGLVTFDDHPVRTAKANLDRVAASAKLRMEGEDVIATIKILDTPMGNIAQQLLAANVQMYLSPVTSVVPMRGKMQLRIHHLCLL